MRRYRLWICGWLAALIWAVGSCGAQANESVGRIAVLLPETGPFAAYGQLQKQGYQLAEIHMAEAVADISVRYFDVGLKDREELWPWLEQTVLPWQPDILIGPYSSEMARQLVALYPRLGIPLIIPTAMLDALTQTPGLPVFRIAPPAGVMGSHMAEFFKENFPASVSMPSLVLAEDSTFSQAVISALTAAFSESGLPVPRVLSYVPGDAVAVLDRVSLAKDVPLMVISRSEQDCVLFNETYGQEHPVIGIAGCFLTPRVQQYAARQQLRLHVVAPWSGETENSEARRFVQSFHNKYRDAFSEAMPSYHTAQAYTALRVASRAIRDAQSSGEGLVSVLKSLEMTSPLGQINFRDGGSYFHQSWTPVVIQDIAQRPVPADRRQASAGRGTASAQAQPWSSLVQVLLGNQLVALFAILAFGLLLGNIKIANISLGSSGVLFVALLFGHFHFTIPSGIGSLGLILFIYCVGISAGPSFFAAFAKQGATLAKLSGVVVLMAAATIFVMARMFHIPVDLAVGIFAGALTSTPALAAALDALKDTGSLVSVGYGIAYPFGVVGVVLFVQLLPRLLRQDLRHVASSADSQAKSQIVRTFIEVQNPGVVGKNIADSDILNLANCQISRVVTGDRLVPVQPDMTFGKGQVLMLVAERKNLDLMVKFLGREVSCNIIPDVEKERVAVVVTSHEMVGRSLRELQLFKRFGVTVTRITRADITFVPSPSTVLEMADKLTAVGEHQALERFAQAAGHRAKALYETDMISLCVGILSGIIVGMIPIGIPGGKSFTLGFSGGPLLVALMLGHFGRIGCIVGRIPSAARNLMRELGLIFFLAQAGVRAGGDFMEIVQEYGVMLFLIGGTVTLLPLLGGYVMARWRLKIGLLETLGGLCGGMTSTPALGAITAKTDSESPVVSYATAYPVALVLMIVFVQILVIFLK